MVRKRAGLRGPGAQAWRCYNTSALDFNIFFCARNSRALAAALAPEEAEAINVTWEAPRDDLKAYFTSHMKYMRVRSRAPAAWAGGGEPLTVRHAQPGMLQLVPPGCGCFAWQHLHSVNACCVI